MAETLYSFEDWEQLKSAIELLMPPGSLFCPHCDRGKLSHLLYPEKCEYLMSKLVNWKGRQC